MNTVTLLQCTLPTRIVAAATGLKAPSGIGDGGALSAPNPGIMPGIGGVAGIGWRGVRTRGVTGATLGCRIIEKDGTRTTSDGRRGVQLERLPRPHREW